MKILALFGTLAALAGLGACAGPAKPKAQAPETAAAPAQAALAQPAAKPGSVGPGDAKAPIQVGPDILTRLKPVQVWEVLAGLDQWGAWNPKVTRVQAGPGLNTGTELRYGWEDREIKAVIQEVREAQKLVWKGARSGSDVIMRWEIRPLGAETLVSLRAVLKPGSGATPIANAGLETQHWIGALQVELSRLEKEKKEKPAK